MSTNVKVEQTAMTNDKELYDWYKNWFESVYERHRYVHPWVEFEFHLADAAEVIDEQFFDVHDHLNGLLKFF